MDDYAINHCDLRDKIKSVMSREDFKEAVMERTGEIVSATQGGTSKKAHKLHGVELVAQSIARSVIDEGAKMVAEDMGVDIDQLKELAASEHISFC